MTKGTRTSIEPEPKRKSLNRMKRWVPVEASSLDSDEFETAVDGTDDNALLDLMVIGRPDPERKSLPLRARFGTKTSRFWFKVETAEDQVAELKEQFKPKALEHIDAEVQERLKVFKEEFPSQLAANITQVREFFLKDIAPLSLAASGGLSQSRDVVQHMVESEVDSGVMSRFEQMVNRATILRLGMFVLKYFNLPEQHLNLLFGGSMNSSQETDLTRLVTMLKETMELPRQDPTGQINGSPHRPLRPNSKRSKEGRP